MCRRAQGGHHAYLRASALEQGREYLERPVGPHARTGHENSLMTTERFCDELGSTAWAESTRAGVAAGVSSLELSHGGSAWLSMWEAGRAGALLRSPRGPEGTPAFSTGECAPESLVVKRRAGQPRVPVDQQARSADQARHRTKPGRQAPGGSCLARISLPACSRQSMRTRRYPRGAYPRLRSHRHSRGLTRSVPPSPGLGACYLVQSLVDIYPQDR